jgi:protein-S-isoprenylcysteine O-methyltransferase Ste14
MTTHRAVPPPNRVPWPPLLVLAAALVAVGLGAVLPGPDWLRAPVLTIPGRALMVIGLGFDLAAMFTMWRHRANILPHRAATALVTTGPFAWSRNPIYLGNTLLLAGAALAFDNPWFLPAALAAAVAVTRLAIVREEAHLAQLFGAEWETYRGRTARWFGRRREAP